MIYYLDTEFAEYNNSLEVISIGIAAEDGRTFYRESSDYDIKHCSAWVRRLVLPKLNGKNPLPLNQIRQDLLDFIGDDDSPRFVAYVASFDHICLTLIFGGMNSLPKGYAHYTWDLRQWLDDMHIKSISRVRKGGGHHHALEDALWLKGECEKLMITQGLQIPPNTKKVKHARSER